jgi:hypothetical protein
MKQYHDPIRQLNYLQQSLSQANNPIGLFLSAGCPLAVKNQENKKNEPLIPDIAGLTKAIHNELCNSKYKSLFEKIIEHFETDEHPEPNIEDILSHIRALYQVAGKGKVRGLTADELISLDDEISRKVVEIVKKSLPNKDTPYHKAAMWIGAIPRTKPVEVFTTNYDLLMEQAMEEQRVPYFDGFVGSRQTFFDTHSMEEDRLPPRWARLWKLHGSINWRKNKNNVFSRGGEINGEQRYVIHPSHLKYDESRRMPYLAMMDRLRSFLKKPFAVLVINGYSFSDHHLNGILAEGLQSNSTAIIFSLVYGQLKIYRKAIDIAVANHNFNLLAEDEAVIGTRRAPWIEKESVDTLESPEIEWVTKDSNDKSKQDTIKSAHFKLGDFYFFGNFLQDLVGKETKEEKKIADK